MKRIKVPLWAQLLCAIALGIVVGLLWGPRAHVLQPWCLVFVKVLKVFATPLLFFAVIDAVVSTNIRARMGAMLVGLSTLNAIVAAVIALAIAHTIPVRRFVDLDAMRQLGDGANEASAGLIVTIDKVLGHLAIQNVLIVIVVAVLAGIVVRFVGKRSNIEPVQRFVQQGLAICVRMLGVMVSIVPVVAFGIVASVIGRGGARLFLVLGVFVALVTTGIALQIFVYYGVLISTLARQHVGTFFRHASAPLLTAMSVGSSLATLPVTLRTLEENLGVKPEAARLAACIGTNLNHDGIILYEATTALFVANVFLMPLSLGAQLKVVLMSIFAAVGIAGVPEAGLITLSLVLGAVGLPLSAVPLLLPVDWLLGRMRATANVASDMTVATILDRATAPSGRVAPSTT